MLANFRRSIHQARLFDSLTAKRRRAGSLLPLVLISMGTLVGVADAARYIMPDGSKVELRRSTTELGIVFDESVEREAAQQTVAVAAQAVFENFVDNVDGPVKIARVPDVSAERRDALLADPIVAEVRPVYYFANAERPVVATGTLVAKLLPGFNKAERDRIWTQYGVREVEPVKTQPDVYLLAPIHDPDLDVEAAERLAFDPRTEWAQPNFRRPTRPLQVNIADEFFSRQWHLQNTGQTGGVAGADIDAVAAWSMSTGEGVLFSMFDHGVDIQHEDLLQGYIGVGHDPTLADFRPGFTDPRPKSFGEFHGTAVMGLAVARANNVGGRGVAFDARWTASRGLETPLSDVGLATVYAFAMEKGVDVHINSWGFVEPFPVPAVIENQIGIAYRQGRKRGEERLGMVIVFAAGNDNRLNQAGFEYSAIPEVISIGASTDFDARAGFSNFGPSLSVMAPGGIGGSSQEFLPQLFTTDNTDYPDAFDWGFNWGGLIFGNPDFPEQDPTGKYSNFFNGTSAACPIAAGVAGLVLSANPDLTSTDVRMILEHTADKIQPPPGAPYDGITGHSQMVGHGRVNARRAVEAALESLNNGGYTWPSRAADVIVFQGDQRGLIYFSHNEGTDQHLIVQSNSSFSFIPEDGKCYDRGQFGCEGVPQGGLAPLPAGVTVLAVGCGLQCGGDPPTNLCRVGDFQCVEFDVTQQTKHFAIYGYNRAGRYSFGVAANSNNVIRREGQILRPRTATGSGVVPPAVTIQATPVEGNSPLTVRFQGNAVTASGVAIDESKTEWNFDEQASPVAIDAVTRTVTHTYTAPPGQTAVFVARLRMFDVRGNMGEARVGIKVVGAAIPDAPGPVDPGALRVIVGLPGIPAADIAQGTSPLDVLLRVDASGLPGTVQSINWDLGDGTLRSGLAIPHTYINESESALSFPITATVTTITSTGMTVTTSATKLISVLPGVTPPSVGRPNLPGTGVSGSGQPSGMPCGAIGMVPLFACVISLTLMRRRRFWS